MLSLVNRNPVLKTLKDNGYRIHFCASGHYIPLKNSGIDIYSHPPEEQQTAILLQPFFDSTNKLRSVFMILMHYISIFAEKAGIKLAQKEIINDPLLISTQKKFVQYAKNTKQPSFTYMTLPGCPPSGSGKIFIDAIKQANQHIQEIVDLITKGDKDSVIIIFGDHGPTSYASGWRPKDVIFMDGVEPDKIALDTFNVLLTIRWPTNYKNSPEILTHVNIFRYLFAYLGDKKDLLLSREKDESYLLYKRELYRVTKDGQALKKWEHFTPPIAISDKLNAN